MSDITQPDKALDRIAALLTGNQGDYEYLAGALHEIRYPTQGEKP